MLESITLREMIEQVEGLRRRWPNGDDPFQMLGRLLEESGELASEVHVMERSGSKVRKGQGPSKERLALEARDVMICVLTLVVYYDAVPELVASMRQRLQSLAIQESQILAN